MAYLDFLYFFVPIFAFAAAIELLHFIPYLRKATEGSVFKKMYSVLIVFLISFLLWDIAFIVEIFFGSKTLHKLFEIAAMSLILVEAVVVVRGNIIELSVLSATNEIIERSEKRYRGLIESMNDGFWALDKNRTTTMVNARMAEMLGYTTYDMIGKDAFFFMDKEAQNEVKKQLKLRAKGIASTYEISFIKKDGSRLPVVISASPLLSDKGEFVGSFAILTDISHRIEMEEKIKSYSQNLEMMVEERTKELVQARDSLVNMLDDLTESKEELARAYDDLKDLDRMKTDIISNISHELRTPITIAKSAIELTREEDDRKEIERFLDMCENALTRLNDIVENLVDISSIYKGRFIFSKSSIDLKIAIKNVLDNFKILAKEKKIKLKFNQTGSLPKVKGDLRALKRSLSTVIDNAIKFNHEGGEVSIDVTKTGGFVQISVKDTGIGIDPKYKDRIFEPFYQIDPTTTRVYGGTGIGLALAKSHIEAQKGRIWVESTPGKGSIFYIKLPISQEKDL